MSNLILNLILRIGIVAGVFLSAYYWIEGDLPEAQTAILFTGLMQLFAMEK